MTDKYLPGKALNTALQACDWEGLSEKTAALLRQIEANEHVTAPFVVVALPSSPQQQKQAASLYFQDVAPPRDDVAWPKRPSGSRIRLGYYSTDFRAHATAHLVAGFLQLHDRSRFEVFAFALGGNAADPMREHIAKCVDHLLDVAAMSDQEIVDLSRRLEIHIAIDLNVYTGRQPTMFARALAPVQVNYLGYPGTSGAPCYDYLIGDEIVSPPEHRAWFSERIVTLPHTYQPNDFGLYGELRSFTRRELNLPEKSFVFCCFNDSFKIRPDIFDIWMRLLKSVEGSVLWLLGTNDTVIGNLRAEAQKRGVSPDRLIFAPRMPVADHLARHRVADLFLDTIPYNAHTTATDALWAGLPVLTCLDQAFAGRVAASSLTAAWLPELITETLADYEQFALDLAADPGALLSIRHRLEKNRRLCPLFNTMRYTRNLESAYARIWQRFEAGQAPDHIAIVESNRA